MFAALLVGNIVPNPRDHRVKLCGLFSMRKQETIPHQPKALSFLYLSQGGCFFRLIPRERTSFSVNISLIFLKEADRIAG
jgi:hypothetical protein